MPTCVSVCLCLVVTCWERADLLALVCGVLLLVCHFQIGFLGQVWYLIVWILDLCTLTYLARVYKIANQKEVTILTAILVIVHLAKFMF